MSKKLQEGDKAPVFEALDPKGEQIRLENYRGKKVILYFYPKDNTPGCTAEACNLRDNYQELLDKGFVVIGVSPDDLKSHGKFIAKNSLPFPLIPDTGKEIINAYGVWGEKNMYGNTHEGVLRTTFVIDGEGKIEKVFDKVKTKDHTRQILDELENT